MKRGLETTLASVVAMAVLCAVTACGKPGSQSPVAPSIDSPSPTPSTVGATISGQVTTGSAINSRVSDVVSGLSVTIVGTSITASVDNAGRFTLAGAPAGNVDLQFGGNGVNVRVSLGQVVERERLEVEIEIHGNDGSVVTTQHITSDARTEVEGRISSLDSAARSLRVGAASIQVPSGAKISSGATVLQFKDLQLQQRVHIHGTMQGAVVSAEEVEVEDAVHPEPQPGDEGEIEFTGSISSLAGSCSSWTMSVAGKRVTTVQGTTAFVKVDCSALRDGMVVEVKGTVQSDGSVLAVRIQAEDDGAAPGVQPEVEFTGSVASMTGSCPALDMRVAGRRVKTSGSTEFKDTRCDDVKSGVTVQVKGTAASDGEVAASRLKIEK
jgi:hypothetical protein